MTGNPASALFTAGQGLQLDTSSRAATGPTDVNKIIHFQPFSKGQSISQLAVVPFVLLVGVLIYKAL